MNLGVQSFPDLFPRMAKSSADRRSLLLAYVGIAFCVAHIPLALVLYRFNSLSTLHGLAVLAVGACLAIFAPRHPQRTACAAAYIMGAEVLWRMTNSQVFWEFGKYASATVFMLSILRRGQLKGPGLIFGYFVLLIPSVAVIIERAGLAGAQGYISFNLSGPLSLFVAAWFFSQLRLSVSQVQGIFLAAIGPILGIASISFFSISAAEDLRFGSESNFVASGGFGPNQVSAALGLGVLLALLFVLIGKQSGVLRAFLLAAMFLMGVQSALTFSRGGLYNAAGAVVLASLYLMRHHRTRRNLVLLAVVVVLVGNFLILPQLDQLTGGTLRARFSETNTTNRITIISEQVRVWWEHPILGVGPGGSKLVGAGAAHTEFARLLAEHGVFGLVAALLLWWLAFKSIRNAKTPRGKALAVALIGWSFLFMLNAAMRLAAPGIMFGIAMATVIPAKVDFRDLIARARRILLLRQVMRERRTVAG